MTTGKMIADAASMGSRYMQRLVKGVPAERFARFATAGGETIVANHPAFALGHLCLYPQKVLQLLGVDAAAAAPPPGFEEVFSKDATCKDDPDGSIYPSYERIITFYEQAYAAALEALSEASDEQLAAENPVDSPMKQICPTLGAMLCFYLTSHVMIHLGQVSTWRRIEGLPPA